MVRNTYADSAALSAAGKMIAFTARLNDRDDIFTISTTGGIGKKITSNNDPRVFFGSLVWAPNGKTIYFDKQARVNTISMFENLR
jgi:Tol biopolymer transport system component